MKQIRYIGSERIQLWDGRRVAPNDVVKVDDQAHDTLLERDPTQWESLEDTAPLTEEPPPPTKSRK